MLANTRQYGALIRCGGMRNAATSGALRVLQDLDCFAKVTHWWTQSSGAPTAIAFTTGQIDQTRKIWVKELTSPRLCGSRSFLACQRFADVDHLVEHCCRSIDFSLLDQTVTVVRVGVVNTTTAQTEYHQVHSGNVCDFLKATCALPALARPITIDGQTYVDGGTLDPLPVKEVMEQVDRLIIFDNRPRHEVEPHPPGIERVLFPRNRKMQEALALRPQRIAESWKLVRQLEAEGRVLVVAPSVRVASRLCRNPRIIERALQIGEDVALDYLPRIRDFLNA